MVDFHLSSNKKRIKDITRWGGDRLSPTRYTGVFLRDGLSSVRDGEGGRGEWVLRRKTGTPKRINPVKYMYLSMFIHRKTLLLCWYFLAKCETFVLLS